jgi:hypothetical protein
MDKAMRKSRGKLDQREAEANMKKGRRKWKMNGKVD